MHSKYTGYYYLLVHILVVFVIVSLLLLSLDYVQEGEEKVLSLSPDLLAPDIFRKIPRVRLLISGKKRF